MRLGASALPPAAYMAFCARQPLDCGEQPRKVLAQVAEADRERAALFASADAALLRSLPAAPSAVSASDDGASAAAPETAALTPSPEPLRATAEPLELATGVTFIDPMQIVRADPQTGAVRMTPQLWSRLNNVNAAVNRAVAESTDRVTYGSADYWATPLESGLRRGDCEDFVLEKKRALVAEGVARAALNIALVSTPQGDSHAVLVVSTTDGDLVLDNLTPWITPWNRSGYRFRQREVGGDAFTWAMVLDPSRLPARTPADLRLAALP